VGAKIAEALGEVEGLDIDRLLKQRYDRFRALGVFEEN
jgi:acetyl-CoA carboxylase alpha subunit